MLLMFGAIFISPLVNEPAKAAWWDIDWEYYKELPITNANNSYPMFFNITKSSGGDINCSDHCQNDFGDLRFLDIDNTTELDYWLEKKSDGNYAWVWVETSSDVETDQKILMYYGNDAADIDSNGTATFEYFDDWTVNNTADWENLTTAACEFYMLNDSNYSFDLGPNIRFRFKQNWTIWHSAASSSILYIGFLDEFSDPGLQEDFIYTQIKTDTDDGADDTHLAWRLRTEDDDSSWDSGYSNPAITLDANYQIEMRYDSAANFSIYDDDDRSLLSYVENDSQLPDDVDELNWLSFGLYHGSQYFHFRHNDSDTGFLDMNTTRSGAEGRYELWVDWMFVDRCNDPEPTLGTVGAEMAESGNTAPVNSDPNPADTDTGVSLTPTISIQVNDSEDATQNMNITFRTNASGAWLDADTNSSVNNGTYYCVNNSWVNEYATVYYWSVNTTDGNGGWDNDTYSFTTGNWGPWSDTWTINRSITCNSTGYLYGNWSFSEHINNSALDESWTEANDSHWDVADDGSWWGGDYTYEVNFTNVPHTFTLINDSGMNRSQVLGWVHLDYVEPDVIYPYVIFAFENSTSFDCIAWSSMQVFALHWNGENMTDIATGANVVNPYTDATDISDQWYQEGVYLTDEGNYYKYIYNELAGTIRFKWWGGGFMNEPAGWATEYQHANLTHDEACCHGIGVWNYNEIDATMQWDLLNYWQLNYTVNDSTTIEINGSTIDRPHMDFPIINMSNYTEYASFLNFTEEGNVSIDSLRDGMKNVTNLMNMESRMYQTIDQEAYDQNDTVYYYSCLLDEVRNFTEQIAGDYPPWLYDEYLHLHIQNCFDGDFDNETAFDDAIIAIDVDNNGSWDSNDRIFWIGADGLIVQFNGYTQILNPNFNGSVWLTEQAAIGNLHRYNSHINYAFNIPLAELIKNNSEPINVSDVFGLTIYIVDDSELAAMNPCVWQNWNETSELAYYDEMNGADNVLTYFFNYTEDYEEEYETCFIMNDTTCGRMGEGVIVGEGFNASGELSYQMEVNTTSNVTSIPSGSEYGLVNYSVYVNNTGSGTLSDIYVNMSWWNCSCSDLNMTYVDSSEALEDITWYNDSCYWVIHDTDIEPLGPDASWHIWFVVNVTNCSDVTSARGYMNTTVNASELDDDVEGNSLSLYWGTYAVSVCVEYTTPITDVKTYGNTTFNIIGAVIAISAIMALIGIFAKSGLIKF